MITILNSLTQKYPNRKFRIYKNKIQRLFGKKNG